MSRSFSETGGARRMRGRVIARVLSWLVVSAIVAAAAWTGVAYRHFTHAPLTVETTGQTLEIARGEGFGSIVRQLRDEQLSSASPLLWRLLALRLGVTNKLHAGEYALAPGMTPFTLLQNLATGKVLHRRVTLVDGWTFAQVREALQKAPRLKHRLDGMDAAKVAAKLGLADQSPEGWFMPDTYDYVLGMSDLDVLARAHATMQKYLREAWARRAASVPLQTPYQALILASLVEKETAAPAELPEIAGVFERRLKLGMKLETDPSVIYGMGTTYTGKIHKVDLETDTPYNTYTRAGLPPTPIALPTRAAIDAVLHPAAGDALYFVAKGDGTHQFSATLAEQNAAVRKYILGKKE
jgi:peptidoglycan lytic transglycosylase G